MRNAFWWAKGTALAVALFIASASTVRAQVEDAGVGLEPWMPPPNLYPSWLSSAHTPAYVPVTYEVPWIQNANEQGFGPFTLRSPDNGSFVSCSGAGGPFGLLPQPLVSSLDGNFGGNFLVENPCFPAPGLYCQPGFGNSISPQSEHRPMRRPPLHNRGGEVPI